MNTLFFQYGGEWFYWNDSLATRLTRWASITRDQIDADLVLIWLIVYLATKDM